MLSELSLEFHNVDLEIRWGKFSAALSARVAHWLEDIIRGTEVET